MPSWAERLSAAIVSDSLKYRNGARLRGEDLDRAIRKAIEEAESRCRSVANGCRSFGEGDGATAERCGDVIGEMLLDDDDGGATRG